MLHMKEDETVDTFTRKLTTLVSKAASLGHTIEDETLVRKLLNVVPDRYLQIVASIEQYSYLSEMTLEVAIGRLKTYEERIKYKKGKQVENQEKLMFTRHENKAKYFRGRGRRKHRFSQGRNHGNFKEEKKDRETSHRNYNINNFKKSSYDTSKLQCYKCKKIGNIAPNYSNEEKHVKEVEEQKVSLHEEDVGYKEIQMDGLWYLNNGASNHMTGVREHFKELDEKVNGKAKARSTSPLDLVYGDLCRPITPPTPSGKKYIFLLVDDYSRYMCVYFLSTKDQAFDAIKEYKKSIENELRTILKTLRTDQGKEFTSNEFTQYYKENGIARQLTAPYLPQQNGVVERRNRTIMSTTRWLKLICVSRDVKFKENETWDWKEYITEDEPKNYKEASRDQKWIEAMKVELDSINRNNTQELTTLPKGHKAIGLKWVFKTKKDANGNIIKHKARLVAKGYIQEHGIDFEEVFAPVEGMETIRLLLAIAANNKWEVHHFDVKSAFLHGDLKEEVYVTQPEGYIKRQDNGKVYRLIKALYGLRQAPHAWNRK
nr:ribonuclease H-like domain, reverse transcriptase, RNA-dependent DNA polymerase [Tanacetum cinerariifolium]